MKTSDQAARGPNLPMVIDEASWRGAAVRRLHEWRRAIARVTRTLDRFAAVDRRAYDAWFAEAVAPLVDEVQRLASEHRAASVFQAHVVAKATLERLSPRQAYRRLRVEDAAYGDADPALRAKIDADRTRRERWLNGDPLDAPNEARGSSRSRENESREKEFNFEMHEEGDEASRPVKARLPRARHVDRAARVKALFRRISRKIHPDLVAGHLKARGRIWLGQTWSDATAARRALDLETLWTIDAEITFAEEGVDALSLGQLRALSERAARIHRQVEAEVARFKRHPAWNLEKVRDRDYLARRLRQPFEAERRRVLFALDQIRGPWRK